MDADKLALMGRITHAANIERELLAAESESFAATVSSAFATAFEAWASFALSAPPDVGVDSARGAIRSTITLMSLGVVSKSVDVMLNARKMAEIAASEES